MVARAPRCHGRLLAATIAALGALLAPGAAHAYTVEKDIPYLAGAGPWQRLDVYRPSPAPAKPVPVVVWVHGGGWAAGDKSNRVPDKARLFTDAGYVFVSVNYRLSPNPPGLDDPARARFPVHPADVAAAVRWLGGGIRSRGGDPSRVVLIGHSAGAQIVTLLGVGQGFLRPRGVDPLTIRGIVALDTEAFDIARDADPGRSTRGLRAWVMLWNAFATPAENAADGTWKRASALGKGDRSDPPALFVTQAGAPARIADNERMAADMGLEPATAVLRVPLDHEGINTALGSPTDTTAETRRVSGFVRKALATRKAPRTRLVSKPGKRLRAPKGKRRVRFAFRSADERATYRCRIDRRRWRRCSSPRAYRLGRGKHRFRVRSETRDGRGPVRSYAFRIVPRRSG